MDRVRVSAIHGGVAYFPVHLARELGFFVEFGLDVFFEPPARGARNANALNAGELDIALGGIWRPIMYRNRLWPLVCIGQVCHRCYLMLAGRGQEDFSIPQMKDRTIIVPAGAPSPGIYLKGLLAKHNIDLSSVTFIHDFEQEEAVALFSAGLGDYIVLPPEPAEHLAMSTGTALVPLAREGLIPWSVYYCTPDLVIGNKRDLPVKFMAAIARALHRIETAKDDEITDVAAKIYPYSDNAVQAIRRCQSNQLWPNTISIDLSALMLWQKMLQLAGCIDSVLDYDIIVDRKIIEEAQALEPNSADT